ncbi:MAG: cation-translocating P-type ATPase [Candidatus Riflebacteria bacterium]|nr:cation-translocating P-type ATPase [Candidatus Riflebacteria bacterium]
MEYRTPLKTILKSGLSAREVESSRRINGSNRIVQPQGDPWWTLYLEKFDDPIIRILIVAAVLAIITGAMKGEYLEGVAIIVTIFLATFLGFLNEWKARLEFDLLVQAKDETPVKVVRDGNMQTLPRTELVVGDVVFMETGDEVPADGELLDAVSLQVDESRLTGESYPVFKTVKVHNESELPQDQSTQVSTSDSSSPTSSASPSESESASASASEEVFPASFVLRGTMIVDGLGVMKVFAVGNQTEAGKVAKSATEEFHESTPLARQLERLGGVISLFGFSGAILIFFALILRGWVSGELDLSLEEGTFAFFLIATVIVAGARYWIPMIYEGLEYAGLEVTSRGIYCEHESDRGLKSLITGIKLFGGLLIFGIISGLISSRTELWFTIDHSRIFLRYFMVVVAIIVVAVPEGLSMAVTLCLAYGMRKMMACNNLVRKLHACETIGAATIICSDKTGTLTQNEMSVSEVAFEHVSRAESALISEVRGDGGISKAGEKTDSVSPAFFNTPMGRMVVESISVNSTAHLCILNGQTVPVGNMTEGALLKWLQNTGIDYSEQRHGFQLDKQWTFSPIRKFMATLGFSSVFGKRLLHVKGAPETVLGKCSSVFSTDAPRPIADERQAWTSYLEGLQSRGMRTLAFAVLELPESTEVETSASKDPDDILSELAHDMTWLGCIAISDPIRPEVPAAIQSCARAGVEVKILTGDHSRTAIEIARQIGLLDNVDPEHCHLSGREFHAMNDVEALERLKTIKILSRARPSDKLRVVSLLKEAGHVVAVTGDGANDAPALHRADVGLSMGKSGTDMAKEASDIILLDDSFASIATGILWGRSLYLNIQRFLVFQLSINLAAVGLTLFGPILGLPLPLTVIQMLWVNLIMDTFAALALATEPPVMSLMDHPPRKKDEFIISPKMTRAIFGFGLFSFVFFLGLLLVFTRYGEISDERLSLFFSMFVLVQFWNLFNIRRFGLPGSAFTNLSGNPWFILVVSVILIGQILIVQFGGAVFRTVPLSLWEWFLMLLGTSPILLVPEIGRYLQKCMRPGDMRVRDDVE